MSGVEELLRRARALAARGRRTVLGIAGPPGAGKSTLAHAIAADLGPAVAVVVGMDGFHLAQAELERLGRAERKGAPDTFDARGYLHLLGRLAAGEDGVYAPEFRREIEEPVAGAVLVPAAVPLVITEGNYLLLPDEPWGGLRALFDEAWYLATDEATRRDRLAARHRRFGRSAAEATARTRGSDQRNAELVAASAARADLVISGLAPGGPARG